MEKVMEQHTGSQRTSLLRKNIAASFLIKGWSAVIVLLMVPLTLKILGVYSNGVWLTISSILIWIDLMDIGLGNGLRNAVAEYVAKGDDKKVREAVSSTYFMLAVIVLPFLLICYAVVSFGDMYDILGVSDKMIANLNQILLVAITISSFTFVLKVTGNFYMGLQLPAANSLIICIGHTLALGLTFALFIAGSHSLLMVVFFNTISLLLIWAICMPYTFKRKYPQYCPSLKSINLKMARSLCSTGLQFFAIQICGVILFMSTNIIISKALSPAEVTPYQIAYRYFNIAFVLFSTICIPFWNATTDAYSRRDYEWIRNSSRKLNLLMLGIFILLLFMVFVSDLAYTVWIGEDVAISHELGISTAIYIFILCYSLRYSYILNGLNVLRIQLIFTVLAAVVFLPLAWYVCKTFGTVTSLVWVMCAVNIPGLLANAWKYHQLFRDK